MIRRNRSEKIKPVDKICSCVLFTNTYLNKKFQRKKNTHTLCPRKSCPLSSQSERAYYCSHIISSGICPWTLSVPLRAGENTLRRLALFVYLDHPTKNDVTSVKKNELGGKIKFHYGIIVLLVSKMSIFRNRPNIFNVLFGHDKQNFVFFLVISVFWRKELLDIQKHAVLKACFLRNVVISSSLNSTRVIVCLEMMNSRYSVSCTQLKCPILLGRHYTNGKAIWQCSRPGRT